MIKAARFNTPQLQAAYEALQAIPRPGCIKRPEVVICFMMSEEGIYQCCGGTINKFQYLCLILELRKLLEQLRAGLQENEELGGNLYGSE